MNRLIWGVVAGLTIAGLAACESDKKMAMDPAKAIADRQALMKDNGAQWGKINDFIEKDMGTAADVEAAAKVLQANAGKINQDLFPAGSSADDMPGKSYAKATVWAEWDKFEKAAYELEEQAEQLAEVAKGGDKAAIKTQFESLGSNGCGGCHKPYRLKKPE